ncbi:MAG: hypothetical protein M1839_006769 [Geoglossum umbratile]|nr:MAG: hypothetical protein M1839_006769 [Geoglossum umbratile]
MDPLASQNPLSHAQQTFRAFLATQPTLMSQNGPQELNGQRTPPDSTANEFSNLTTVVQGHVNNTNRNNITRTVQRGLSVNTEMASQRLPSALPSAIRATYAIFPQSSNATSPATPGVTTLAQPVQMQRLRQQQNPLDQISLHRRSSQVGQQHPNTGQVVPSQPNPYSARPSTTAHIPNGSAYENGSLAPGPGVAYPSGGQVVSVPAGAPDPQFNPTTGVFPSSTIQRLAETARQTHSRARSQAQTPLLPSKNFTPILNPGPPNPNVTALHQAHLRSPYLKCATPPAEKLYQYLRDFPLQPTIFSRNRPRQSYHFDIPIRDSQRIAMSASEPMSFDKRDFRWIRIVHPGSLMFRIRCVKLPSANLLSEDKWVTSESQWPDHIFIDVNQAKMETRRRLHFGKDLPIDITDYVKAGENALKITILRSQREIQTNYAIAVEAIEVITHSVILRFASQNLIPAEQSLNAIKACLNPIPDDEIAVVNSDLTINISDPFSAQIFNIPARSRSCLHRECFDLETFLATRASKPGRPTEPCMADDWKCPLCASDARPHRLLIDGFLLDVKRELHARLLGEIRAIVVDKDGKWVPKIEPGYGGANSTPPATAAVSATATSTATRGGNVTPAKEKAVVIIDLEDD